jgi:hypothetical protein
VNLRRVESGIIIGAVALAAALALSQLVGRARGRERVLVTTAAQLGDVRAGERVRITGVARALDHLTSAPIGGQPCIAFRLLVEAPAWRRVLERSDCVRFLLVDADSAVVVEGPFRLLLHTDYDWEFGHDVQRRLAELVATDSHEAGVRSQSYRYFEALIRPGDRVTVEGFASAAIAAAGTRAGLRAPPMRYALRGADEPTVVSIPLRD